MNVLDIWFFIIPALLLLFAISRPVISGRNYIVLMVVVPFIIGAFLIPYSLELENGDYFAVKKASWLICIALISFLITVILLYRIKKRVFLKEEINRFALDILHRWEQTSNARLFIILFLFSLLGFLVLMLTFFKTGNIPISILLKHLAKYFEALQYIYHKAIYTWPAAFGNNEFFNSTVNDYSSEYQKDNSLSLYLCHYSFNSNNEKR